MPPGHARRTPAPQTAPLRPAIRRQFQPYRIGSMRRSTSGARDSSRESAVMAPWRTRSLVSTLGYWLARQRAPLRSRRAIEPPAGLPSVAR